MKKLMKKYTENQKGLTLVELLAVLVILGIVAAIAVVSIGNVIQNSREDAAKADAIQILNAAQLFVAQNGTDDDGTLTLTSDELGSGATNGALLSDEGFFEGNDWEVAVTENGSVLAISSDGALEVGSAEITFTNATVAVINADSERGTRTISP